MCLNPSLSEIVHVNNAADIDDLNLSSHGALEIVHSKTTFIRYLISKLQGIKMNMYLGKFYQKKAIKTNHKIMIRQS